MKNEDTLLAQLIQSFKILPGIGEKSAQRMAFYLLKKIEKVEIILQN